jgi:CheY-like chemotaxis protein
MAPTGRILIVDDDRLVSQTFARILSAEGFAVTLAHSAEAGLEQAGSTQPDAILLDLRMPGADGLHFLLRLRQDPLLRDLPVGVVTGDRFIGEHALAELHALGATVRFKPLQMADLIALVASLFSKGIPT